MTEKHSLSLQCIIDCLNANYGIAVNALIFLPIGADMNASVYRAKTQDGLSYFVKLKRSHRYDMSVAILALLHASGIQQIIPPIKATDGALTQHIVDWDEPIMAPKERDLMFVVGGVANTWNNPREEEFFYKGNRQFNPSF